MTAPVRTPSRATLSRKLIPTLAVNWGGSTAVYFLLTHACGSDAVALAGAGAVPVIWTLGRLALHRKADPVRALAVAGYASAVILALLTSGNPLVLELHEATLTGAFGMACLVSLAVRRPLHGIATDRLARSNQSQQRQDNQARQRVSTVITALVGCTLLTHALVQVVLAVTVPPSTYMALRHLVGVPILGLGVAALVWYRRRVRRQPTEGICDLDPTRKQSTSTFGSGIDTVSTAAEGSRHGPRPEIPTTGEEGRP